MINGYDRLATKEVSEYKHVYWDCIDIVVGLRVRNPALDSTTKAGGGEHILYVVRNELVSLGSQDPCVLTSNAINLQLRKPDRGNVTLFKKI